MKSFTLTILSWFFISHLSGQIRFSTVDSKLRTVKSNNSTQLICSNSAMSIKFQLNRNVAVMQLNNFVTIDSQVIQVIPLKFSSTKKDSNNLSMNDQKELLQVYSKYELDYFRNELHIEVINLNSQWVVTKSIGWFIWYFRVGNVPTQVEKRTEIQLFATTMVGADKVLTINAPILTGDDFAKAGLIVNEMMETFAVGGQ